MRDPITEREAVALMGAHTIGKVGGFRFINDVITTETVSIRCSPYYHTPITEAKKQPVLRFKFNLTLSKALFESSLKNISFYPNQTQGHCLNSEEINRTFQENQVHDARPTYSGRQNSPQNPVS